MGKRKSLEQSGAYGVGGRGMLILFKILNAIICLLAVFVKNEDIKFPLIILGGIGIMIQILLSLLGA